MALRQANLFQAIACALFLVFTGGRSSAQVVQVHLDNPSFEDYVLGLGNFTTGGQGLSGWTVEAGAGSIGVFHPGSQYFTSNPPVPDGVNTAYSHAPAFHQDVCAVVAAGATYTLTVEIGRASNVPFGGYRVQLLAAGVVVAEDNNTAVPPLGGWITSTVVFVANPGDPSIGGSLRVRLESLGQETNFDDVQLTATGGLTIPASETVRIGTPANPDAFRSGLTTAPILGRTWDPAIDHTNFAPGAFADFVAFSTQGPANLATAPGTLLIAPPFGSPTFLNFTPGSAFAIPIPPRCSLLGASVWTQGGSVSPGPVIELSNALDLVLGNI